jgi:hypothetical protein
MIVGLNVLLAAVNIDVSKSKIIRSGGFTANFSLKSLKIVLYEFNSLFVSKQNNNGIKSPLTRDCIIKSG